MSSFITVKDLTKSYRRGRETVHALQEVSLGVEQGELVAIVGPSGSGKTTLLQQIGCIDRATKGTISIDGVEISDLPESKLDGFRSSYLGFVFQRFHLIPTLSALENVVLPLMFSEKKHRNGAQEILERVGLGDRLSHRPSELSGGEMQRVAIARALINQPEILLADEPTGNLDSENATAIWELFKELNEGGLTIMLVTHNRELATKVSRCLTIRDGRLSEPIPR